MFDEILRGIIQKGKALEVNGRGTGIPYIPEDGILRRYRELGGELVTYGSTRTIRSCSSFITAR